jgi:hypothetical protein
MTSAGRVLVIANGRGVAMETSAAAMETSLTPISAARLQQEATNAAINAEVTADMRAFLQRQQRLGGVELLSLSSVSDWARQSDWSFDTGGERDARGAPVRATGGVWAEMFFQAQAQLVAEARERHEWREYFDRCRELRRQARAAAESDGRLARSGLQRVAWTMGVDLADDALDAATAQLASAEGRVDVGALEAWWGARGLHGDNVSLQAEQELAEAWQKTLSFKVGRRVPTHAWRQEFLDELEQCKLASTDLAAAEPPQDQAEPLPPQTRSPLEGARVKPAPVSQQPMRLAQLGRLNSDLEGELDSPVGRPAQYDREVDGATSSSSATAASPRTPLQPTAQQRAAAAGSAAMGTPSRTPASVGKTLDMTMRNNSTLGCPANALPLPPSSAAATADDDATSTSIAAAAAVANNNQPDASPLLVAQRQQIGDLRAESDLLRRALASSEQQQQPADNNSGGGGGSGEMMSTTTDVPCRIFEQFVVIGAAHGASNSIAEAANGVSW